MAIVPPRGYYTIYAGQLQTGLNFLGIVLSQLVSNSVQVIVDFKAHYQACGVLSSFDLFHTFFAIKCSPILGWFFFSS